MDRNSIYAEQIFTHYVKEYSGPNAVGEMVAKSPFPFSGLDNTPSLRFNINSGAWKDFKHNIGGGVLQFIAYMESIEEPDSRSLDLVSAQNTLNEILGIATTDKSWYAYTVEYLQYNQHLLKNLQKPWSIEACKELGIGYCEKTSRFTIPIHSPNGKLAKVGMYNRSVPKMYWNTRGVDGNFLFPAVENKWYILTEGMPDAITLRTYGFPGVSGTLGAGSPVPPGNWYIGKKIFILMDSDAAGLEAEDKIQKLLGNQECELFLCRLPDWNGKPAKADISDLVMYLIACGYDRKNIIQFIESLLLSATRLNGTGFVSTEKVDYDKVLDTSNSGKIIKFECKIAATSQPYALVKRVFANCPTTGHAACNTCTMKTQFRGNAIINLDHNKQETISLVQKPTEAVMHYIKKSLKIYPKCADLNMEVQSVVDAEICLGAPPKITESVGKNRVEIFVPGKLKINSTYEISGHLYGHPETQKLMVLATGTKQISGNFDECVLNNNEIQSLKIFQNKGSVWDKLIDTNQDLSESCTGIYGRHDLHIAYNIAFFSPINFYFSGKLVEKGWVDMLVVGDTRCGKSQTYRAMSKLYETGSFVDCKNMTTAGILGAVEKSAITGESYVVSGVLPQNDKGIVFFDEFRNNSPDGGVLSNLASARSEGIVTIVKAASAEFPARTRMIWTANPGAGLLISQMGRYGCEIIHKLIPQPEDVARFTYALVVSQDDVSSEIINQNKHLEQPRYPVDFRRKLLQWAWSRKAENIIWDEGVEDIITKYAEAFCSIYSPTIPLVEIAEQRIKIAKMAISIAMQVFSTSDGINVLVKAEHAEAAAICLTMFYQKKSMAYDKYSSEIKERSRISSEDIRKYLVETMKANLENFCDQMLRATAVTERVFVNLCPAPSIVAVEIFNYLIKNKCLHQGRDKDVWIFNPKFCSLMRQILEDI